jgi:hypothetical protein
MECDYEIYANYKGLSDAGRRCNKIATGKSKPKWTSNSSL